MVFWLNPPLQKKIEYRPSDTIISVPAKSGTTWTMNIFHQLRTGGDADFKDIYAEVPWAEFKERPDQSDEELLERWKAMPQDEPRAFKSHASPGPNMDFDEKRKYIVVFRNPEEALCSFYPFLNSHSDEIWKLWDAEFMKDAMFRPTFDQWFHEVALAFKPGPPDAPEVPGGMINVFFASFINGWWQHRHKENVLFLHFADMKKDHEGSVRRIAAFLGFEPTDDQWPKILELTSFAWMKQHEDKFEAATVAPVPVLKRGAMVRKGQTGVQKDDGMTAEIADSIKSWVEKLVPDPECRRWMYEGGALPAKSTGS